MELKTAIFYFISAILVFAALRVISARNPVHAVLFLVLSFVSAGSIWMLLEAEFLAIALIMVYVGAVIVLFLFVVMMLDISLERIQKALWDQWWIALPVGVLMFLEIAVVVGSRHLGLEAMPEPASHAANYSNTKELGRLLFTDFAYPLELASVILLVALIAAVLLTLRRRRNPKVWAPHQQLGVNKSERLRIVAMPPVTDQAEEGEA